MTLRVIGSGEIVQQVFWLDTRTRTCGVMLFDPETDAVRCCERQVADLLVHGTGGRTTRAGVELMLGDQAGVILRDEAA